MSAFGEDFGQKVDLTASIRNILRNYPEGTAILKELVQNADDAGARSVRFCLDHRSHGSNQLAHEALSQFQGPSLLVYNSAVFTEEDFRSIQRIGDSLKNSEETSKTKIGRFGIGFNAVYHWTELPSFISDHYLVMLDPQARFLPNVNPSNPGKIVDWIKNKEILTMYSDQFLPYSMPGMDWKKSFNGTLFRLPLRTAEQASTSYLSKRSLTSIEAQQILEALIQEATTMLLFLRNVEKIEVQEWRIGDTAPTSLYVCEINNTSTAVREQRSFDSILGKNKGSKMDPNKVIQQDFLLDIKILDRTGTTHIEKWEICTQFGGGEATAIARDPRHAHLKLVPLAGTAACVSTPTNLSQDALDLRKGVAYCFLPLPIRTQLPIMINGFFELSSNRRDIWQAGVDMTGDGYTRANWNIALLRDVVSACYLRLLLKLRDVVGNNDLIFYESFWPSHAVAAPWNLVTQSTMQLTKPCKLLPIRLPPKSNSTTPMISWIEPEQAVVLPLTLSKPDIEAMYQILQHLQAPNIQFHSDDLHETVIKTSSCTNLATPAYIRQLLRRQTKIVPEKSMCKTLVKYCFSDLLQAGSNASRVGHVQLSPTKELHDLPIIPLLNDQVGKLMIFDAKQMQSINQLINMGYSMQDSMVSLMKNSFEVDQAWEWLSVEKNRTSIQTMTTCYILSNNKEEREVFGDASALIIDTEALYPNEVDMISQVQFLNSSNIRNFSKLVLKDVLSQILPADCLLGKTVNTAIYQNVEKEKLQLFLSKFWKYMSTRAEMISTIADSISIVPSIQCEALYPLSRIANMLATKRGDILLPLDIIELLAVLRIPLLGLDELGVEVSVLPAVFWEYVHNPSRRGLLKSLEFLCRDQDILTTLSHVQRNSLRTYLASGSSNEFNDADYLVIRRFPIFPVRDEKVDQGMEYIDLNRDANLFLMSNFQDIPAALHPQQLVYYSNPQEMIFLQKLKLSMKSKFDFYKTIVLPNAASLYEKYPREYEDCIVHLLLHVQHWMKDDGKAISVNLQKYAFIPTNVKTLHRIADLFDPSEVEMVLLLDDRYFPSQSFRNEECLMTMRSFGLKTIINWDGVITCAKSIETFVSEVVGQRQQRGIYLLQYLDKNIVKLLGEEKKVTNAPTNTGGGFSSFFTSLSSIVFQEKSAEDQISKEQIQQYINVLREINWVPVISSPPIEGLPWISGSLEEVAKPNDTAPVSESWLCSASLRLVDINISSSSLRMVLGWDRSRSILVAIKQLLALSSMTIDKSTSSVQMMTTMVPQLYKLLDQSSEVSVVRTQLEPHSWIWVGHEFISIDKVALSISVNAAPYLYQVPEELKAYPQLLSLFNIKASFSTRDYILALQAMARDCGYQEHNTSNGGNSSGGNMTALSDALVDVATSLVALISNENSTKLQSYTIFVPDSNGRLTPSAELMNDDVPWLVGPEFISMRSTCHFVHPSISNKVAEKVGVKSLRVSLVNNNLEQNIFKGVESNVVESFGQAESLTNRLKTILDLYPDGSPILNELIQNADDAGATMIRIMIDENIYDKESLLDTRMEALQGPALVIQNNATFTESDFRSLASVGQNSKLEKLTTTGRFGLGFNSTYHITDTPMFVSGDYMVFFDPHCHYVPGATLNQPGIRMKFTNSTLPQIFPNQFEPFYYYGFDAKQSYAGTLFRFPLRTSPQAKKSEICKRAYQLNDVESIISQLIAQLPHILLFLRSIECIEIYRCDGTTKKPVLLHSVHSKTSQVTHRNDQSMMQFFEKTPSTSTTSTTSSHNNHAYTKDLFYQQLKVTNDPKLPSSTMQKTMTIRQFESENQRSEQLIEYLVVRGLSGGRAKMLACSEAARDLKLIPFGSVAACLSWQKKSFKSEETVMQPKELFPAIDGQVFCFLPTPIKSNLFLHVNAYWELSSNRRDIWRGEDTKGDAKLRSDWNVYVLQDVLAPLCCQLLVSLHQLIQQLPEATNRRQVLSMLPGVHLPEPWDLLAKALYPLLKSEAILWSNLQGGRAIACRDAYLLDDTLSIYDENQTIRLEKLMLEEGIPVVLMNKQLITCFETAQAVAGVVDIHLLKRLFDENNKKPHPCLQGAWDQVMSNACFLLQCCLKSVQKEGLHILYGLKLLPLSNQSLGLLGSPLEVDTYYLASDIERKVLQKASSRIIADVQTYGLDLQRIISSQSDTSSTHEVDMLFNVKKIQNIDVLKLIHAFLPAVIFQSHVICIQKTALMSKEEIDEWIPQLWKYVLDQNVVELYDNVFPVVPILSTQSLPVPPNADRNVVNNVNILLGEGNLVRMSKQIPIVMFEVGDSDQQQQLLYPYMVAGLETLGIYVLQKSACKSFMHHPSFQALLQVESASGYLQALAIAFREIGFQEKTLHWNTAIRFAIQQFILYQIIDKIESLQVAEQELLWQLPIWLKHSRESSFPFPTLEQIQAAQQYTFEIMHPSSSFISPRDIPLSYLNQKYVWIRSERERILYSRLGLQTCSLADYYTNDVLESIRTNRTFSTSELQWLGPFTLQHLETILIPNTSSTTTLSKSDITAQLSSCAMFSNEEGDFKAASELYDPTTSGFQAILPKSLFPAKDHLPYLHAMKQLGLRCVIDGHGVLSAAKSIEKDQNLFLKGVEEDRKRNVHTKPFQSYDAWNILHNRSKALLRYLESHIELLLQEVSPIQDSEASSDNIVSGNNANANNNRLGGNWGNELRMTTWIPVYTTLPEFCQRKGLPWPNRIHQFPFAAPTQCTSVNNIYFATSTLRISSVNVESVLLMKMLAWDKAVKGSSIAIQLMNMSEEYFKGSSAMESNVNLRNTLEMGLNEIYPHLLSKLNEAYERESPVEVNHWINTLINKPILWSAKDGFIEAARYAFNTPENIPIEPFLFAVPNHFQVYKKFLLAVGVKETFTSLDLARLTQQLAQKYGMQSLSKEKVASHVGIIDVMLRLLEQEVRKEANLSATDAIPAPSNEDETLAVEKAEPIFPVVLTKDHIKTLGLIYIPDGAGNLHPAGKLTINDAPWISANIINEKFQHVRFVHPLLPSATAELLGAASLRELLFTGEDVLCPSAASVHSLVEDDSLRDCITDVLHVADTLNCRQVKIIYDSTHHPQESLLHPGLAPTQGPAVCFVFPQVIMSYEEISKALSLSEFSNSASASSSSKSGTATVGTSTTGPPLDIVPCDGKKLLSTFAITDCLQILSADELFVFDPCGLFLLQAEPIQSRSSDIKPTVKKEMKRSLSKLQRSKSIVAGSTSEDIRNIHPKAQRFKLTQKRSSSNSNESQNVMQSFSDQFIPFQCLQEDIAKMLQLRGAYQGTIIRLPLRTEKSVISSTITSMKEIQSTFGSLTNRLEATLLFAKSIQEIVVAHMTVANVAENDNKQEQAAPKQQVDLEVEINADVIGRNERWKLLQDQGWTKKGLTAFFTTYVPPEYTCTLAINLNINAEKVWILPSKRLQMLLDTGKSATTSQSRLRITERWMLHSTMGMEPLRELACSKDIYTSKCRLLPFTSVAIPLLTPMELRRHDVALESGFSISNSAIIANTGLPFHTEGFFVQLRRSPLAPNNVMVNRDLCQQWNIAVYQVALQHLYSKALIDLRKQIEHQATTSQGVIDTKLLQGFYKYWIYQPRLDSSVKTIIRQHRVTSSLYANTSSLVTSSSTVSGSASNSAIQAWYLDHYKFTTLDKVMFLSQEVSIEVRQYVRETFPLASCPVQIVVDLQSEQIPVIELTAERLRAFFKRDANIHVDKLRKVSKKMVYELLKFAVQDMPHITTATSASEGGGEFQVKKQYKKLAGVPLLAMMDGSVKCFPNSIQERKCILSQHGDSSNVLKILPSSLLPFLVDSELTHALPLLQQPLFKEVLYLSEFNAGFLRGVIHHLIPSGWITLQVLAWADNTAHRSITGYQSLNQFEVFLYYLWNHCLGKESMDGLSNISEYPLLPVISRGRRILVPTSLLQYTLVAYPSALEDRHRSSVKQSLSSSNVNSETRVGVDNAETNSTANASAATAQEDWLWTKQRAGDEEIVKDEEEHMDSRIIDEDTRDSFSEPVPQSTPVVSANDHTGISGEMVLPVEEDNEVTDLQSLPLPLYQSLVKLGSPFLDGCIFEGRPQALRRRTGDEEVHYGRQVLDCLFFLHEANFIVQPAWETSASSSQMTQSLLDFNSLSPKERSQILKEIYQAHRAHAFSDSQVDRLKSLPLFTSSNSIALTTVASANASSPENEAVSMNLCTQGLYWCSDHSVLQMLSAYPNPSSSSASSSPSATANTSMPVILNADEDLLDIYRWLNIPQLTSSTAFSKFVLPQMSSMTCLQRIDVLLQLAKNWAVFRADTELVNALKTKKLIPLWQMNDPEAWRTEAHLISEESLRTCEELLQWTNNELYDALHGIALPNYYCPPSLRTAEFQVLFADLGMQAELNEALLFRVVEDIHQSVQQCRLQQTSQLSIAMLAHCNERGRKLIRYLLSSDRSSTLLQNNNFTRKIGKLQFVPMRSPLRMEEGGFVEYQDDVGSYDQFISKTHGMKAFTILPILEEDVTPSLLHFSSLGIVSSPSKEIVLRHVRNLMQAKHLDRWNTSQFTIVQTFNAIFEYLAEHWKTLPVSITKHLQSEGIIPVGNVLIPPNRIFFRLTEDLAPFMHELPRSFGNHETFLKQLGIRETPDALDYVSFLKELSSEVGQQALNPNELKAVLTILFTICHQVESGSSTNTATNSSSSALTLLTDAKRRKDFYVLDEDACLRPIDQCIVNNDHGISSLRQDNIKRGLQSVGFYFLHPSLASAHDFPVILRMHMISALIQERLESADATGLMFVAHEDNIRQHLQHVLKQPSFQQSLASLVVKECDNRQRTQKVAVGAESVINAEGSGGVWMERHLILAQLNAIDIRIVQSLRSKFYFQHPTTKQEVCLEDLIAMITSGQPSSFLASSASDAGSLIFLQKFAVGLHGNNSIVYINSQLLSTQVSVEFALALGLCQVFGLDRIIASTVADLLKASNQLGVVDGCELTDILGLNERQASSKVLLRGCPGVELSLEDQQRLELRPTRIFRLGEIVAYEEEEEGEGEGKARSVKSKYFYGKVLQIGDANGLGLRKIDLKTGNGTKRFMSTNVYSFKSARSDKSATETASSSSSIMAKWTTSMFATKMANVPKETGASSEINLGESKLSSVSQNELISAVRGLLDRAGLPISLEQQEMMTKVFELEAAQRQMEDALKLERQQQVQARQALEKQVEAFKCTICISKNVDHVLVPCGHTFCEDCANHLQHNKCHYCRTLVRQKVKLFIGNEST